MKPEILTSDFFIGTALARALGIPLEELDEAAKSAFSIRITGMLNQRLPEVCAAYISDVEEELATQTAFDGFAPDSLLKERKVRKVVAALTITDVALEFREAFGGDFGAYEAFVAGITEETVVLALKKGLKQDSVNLFEIGLRAAREICKSATPAHFLAWADADCTEDWMKKKGVSDEATAIAVGRTFGEFANKRSA